MKKYLILLSLGICSLLSSCASAPSAKKGNDGPPAETETSAATEHGPSGNAAISVENLPEPEEVEIFDEGDTESPGQTETHEDDTPDALEPLADDEAVFISSEDDEDTPGPKDSISDEGIDIDADDVPLITDGSTLISEEDEEASAQDEIQEPQDTAPTGTAERTVTSTGNMQESPAQSRRDTPPSPAASGTERTPTGTAGATAAEGTDADDGPSEPQEQDEQTEQEAEEEPEVITPSRSVTLKSNQYLDVVYPGSGWVYLGETDGGDRIRYFGRKVGTSDTSFSLRTKEEGSTILHFYKNDALTGNYIDDYLAVEIKGKSSDNSHVTAPSYAEAIPPKSPLGGGTAQKAGGAGSANASGGTRNAAASSPEAENSANGDDAAKGQEQESPDNSAKENAPQSRYDESTGSTAIQNSETAASAQGPRTDEGNSVTSRTEPAQPDVSVDTENLSADEILDLAQKSYDSAQYAETLAYLNAFFEKAVNRVDEGLFLQGQALEANSSVRNIKAALDIYETIVRRYPQSINWAKANERITYLRRFYFNIR